MGLKITIAEARAAGCETLLIACEKPGNSCRHTSEMTVMLALTLWGEDRRLDDFPLKCSACGSRVVDVRPHYVAPKNDGTLDALVRKSWGRK